MATGLDWEGARRREAGAHGRPAKATKRKGITNAQAKLLAALSRQHGIPYTGQGMSSTDASQLIGRLKRQSR